MSPRKTRAAARAQQQHTYIAIDSPAYDPLPASNEYRKALGEITGNRNAGAENDAELHTGKGTVTNENMIRDRQDISQEDSIYAEEEEISGNQDRDVNVERHLDEPLKEVELHDERCGLADDPNDVAVQIAFHKDSASSHVLVGSQQGEQFDLDDNDDLYHAGRHLTLENKTVASDHVNTEVNAPVCIAISHGYDGAFDDPAPVISPGPYRPGNHDDPSTPQRTDFSHSIAVQRLEALFEPVPSEESGLEESSIAEILARTPVAMTPRESLNLSATPDEMEGHGNKPVAIEQPAGSDQPVLTPALKSKPREHIVRRSVATKPNRPPISTSRPSLATKAPTSIRRSSVQAPARRSTSVAQTTSATGEATARLKQRSAIAALHTPPKLARSTKPTTKSNFRLPGDAITAKLKAQREERIKKEAEEAQNKREFKARPPPNLSTPVEVKQTVLSRSRMSLQVSGVTEPTAVNERGGISNTTSRRSTMQSSAMGGSRKGTTPALQHVESAASANAEPSTSLPIVGDAASDGHKPNAKPRVTPRQSTSRAVTQLKAAVSRPSAGRPSLTSATRTSKPPPIANTAIHRANGREVFNRDKIELEQRDKAMREKAEAAKKARAEAAERSRIASREWAERQKAKSRTAGSRNVSGSETGSGSGSGNVGQTVEASAVQ